MRKSKILGILVSYFLCIAMTLNIFSATRVHAEEECDYNMQTELNVQGINIEAEDIEDVTYDGYIEMPWDDDVPAVNPNISVHEAGALLVKDDNWLDRGGDDFNLPVAWPYDHSRTTELNEWFDTKLTPLRNQGSEGTCWAHSSMSLIENYLLFHNGKDINGTVGRNAGDIMPGVNYSELQLAYFYYHNNENPLISGQTDIVTLTDDNSFLAIGGNLGIAGQTLMKWRGAVDEALVPYSFSEQFDTAAELKAEEGLPEYLAYKEDVVHITKSYQISIKNNPAQVKQAIKENGVVGVSYYSNKSYYNSEYNSYYNSVNTTTNHAVCIVGWDDDFPAEYFGTEGNRPVSNGAWLIRNSWMDTLKNPNDNKLRYQGYFWMSYEDTSLKDAAYVFEATSGDEYDNNYYYTNQMYKAGKITMSKGANVFTVNGSAAAAQERLDAVILQTPSANVNYTISVYSVDEDGKPLAPITDGYVETEGTIVFPGIYTIPLNQPVVLDRGTKYAIVVDTPNQEALGIEHDMSSSGNYTVTVNANAGESFYYWNNKWQDLAELETTNSSWNGFGNLCIQALTTDMGSVPEKIDGISITVRGTDSVTLKWDSLGGSTTYNVYRALGSFEDSSFTKVASNLALTSYTDIGIPANSHCYYRVVPVVSGQEKADLASRTVATVLKPTDDTTLVDTVETQWTGFNGKKAAYGKACDGAAGHIIRLQKQGSTEWIEAETESVKNSGVYYWAYYTGELAPGRYNFTVKPYSVNLYGERVYGAAVEGGFIAYYPAPENLTARYSKSNKTVTLKWDAVEGAVEYKVYTLREDSGTTKHTTLGSTTSCTFVHQNVSEDTTYRYAIYVYDKDISDGSFSADSCWKYANRVELEFYTDSNAVDIRRGDVNEDGDINAKDVTTLRRFLAGGWNVTINDVNSDINGDGEVNAKDVTMLRRALAGGWGIVLE